MASSLLFLYLIGSIYWAIIQDVVNHQNVGSVGGYMHFLANTAGILDPTVTGYLDQVSGTYTAAFLLSGSLAILTSLAVIRYV
ncbi:hypothetical protein ABE28_011945 [Peribacillus muralis]|uniref:Major facilitator superfamily (MFS) profile domain-containing protein n=1 Tax=Peribacillus muralis TaxID=264697 RepID=A0A1B3XPD0_9BACI|nr:hypothetical protein ABE28_011945 [Peribacillus muralis]